MIDKKVLENEIKEIISDVSGYNLEEIKPNTNLINELEIDSIKAIEITVAIEKKYKISVRDEDVPKIVTLTDAVELVYGMLNQKGN
ncbi:MAG: acyl carrier protein [Nitrospirae bacterium]|nr:acyl carrier protein [Nitrospirota bacterium]